MNRAELEMKKQQLEKDVAKYYNMQMAKKIQFELCLWCESIL